MTPYSEGGLRSRALRKSSGTVTLPVKRVVTERELGQCLECGVLVTGYRADKKFCTKQCQKRYWFREHPLARKQTNRKKSVSTREALLIIDERQPKIESSLWDKRMREAGYRVHQWLSAMLAGEQHRSEVPVPDHDASAYTEYDSDAEL